MSKNQIIKKKQGYLIVTIDTEEDMPKWKPEPVTTVKNIQKLPQVNEIFQQYSVRPTYLVDRPVLSDEASCKIIQELKRRNNCEIGMHLHSWNTPPIMPEEEDGKATVLNLYSKEIQKQKIINLHNYFIRQLGIAPTSYRAGRYGITNESLEILAELGYQADSSIAPLRDYSDYGAPNFKNNNYKPFWIKTSTGKNLLEVPITIALVTNFSESFKKIYFSIPGWTKIKGAMYRLNLARLIWLRPTNYNYREMRQVAEFIIKKEGCPIFNIMFHSSELYPGASPYNQNENHVAAFTDRLFKIIHFLIKERGIIGVTLSEFANLSEKLKYPIKNHEL